MQRITVKPRRGLTVLRPDTLTALSAAGEAVPKNTYWLRRLADGDVIATSPAINPAAGADAQE